MGRVKDIINGWSNYFQGSNDENLELAIKRSSICEKCPSIRFGLHAAVLPDAKLGNIKGHYCGECGCPLSPAVRSKDYECPLKKW